MLLDINAENKKAEKKYGILGIEWDQGDVNGRPGAKYAPKSVKQCAERFIERIQDNKIFDVENWRMLDLANISVKDFGQLKGLPVYDWMQAYDRIEDTIGTIIEEGRNPVIIGGDCSLNYVAAKSLHDTLKGKMGVVYMDAHFDTLAEDTWCGKYSHSSPLRNILNLPNVDADNVVQLGVRGYVYPKFYEFVEETGYHVINNTAFFEMGVEKTAEKILERVTDGTEKVMLCLDIDVLEGIFSPGSSCNESAGPSARELEAVVKKLAPYVDGICITEINVMADLNDITSMEGAKLMWDYIMNNYGSEKA